MDTNTVAEQEKKHKKQVKAYIEREGFVSYMNKTKWKELLFDIIPTLPFKPVFAIQYILGKRKPVKMQEVPWYSGDWSYEHFYPF